MNEHLVDLRCETTDRYALVLYEALAPQAVLVFERASLGAVCARLGKRHPDQYLVLALTQRNYRQLLAEADAFAAVGVTVWRVPPGP